MSKELLLYSIQQTYILSFVSTSKKKILTCEQRIDVPTIEPLPNTEALLFKGVQITVVPCIEIVGNFLNDYDLKFETNEGVTVLPINIGSADRSPLENPYRHYRYVLVLPRGATGVKSCRLAYKRTGETVKEVQHNLTFGIMPPPYNYDNALFGCLSGVSAEILGALDDLNGTVRNLKLSTKRTTFKSIKLHRDAGKQTINIEDGVLFYDMGFIYASSVEPITHKPKITLHADEIDFVYTLSLNKTMSAVSIDLFTGKITVYDPINGEIIQQFMVDIPFKGFETLSFEDFYDIETSYLEVFPKGARVI